MGAAESRGVFARTDGSGHHERVTSPIRATGRQPDSATASSAAAPARRGAARGRGRASQAGTPDSELLDRLEDALARSCPRAERAAVMTAYGYGEGCGSRRRRIWASTSTDAEALSRNALQLLRGALADAEPDDAGALPAAGLASATPRTTQRPRTRVRGPVRRPARSPHGVRWLEATFLGPGAMDRIGKLLWCRDKATQS